MNLACHLLMLIRLKTRTRLPNVAEFMCHMHVYNIKYNVHRVVLRSLCMHILNIVIGI